MIDPQARALIDLIALRQLPAVHMLSPIAARDMYRDRRQLTQPEPPAVAEVRELRTDCGVALRLYRPQLAGVLPLPVLVYFHGGGWTIGDLETHDVLCRQLCLGAGVVVVAVDYGLSPEVRFPGGLNDCVQATRWVRAHATELGVDPARIAVGGDSAGGNLAAAVALTLRDADARADESSAPPLAYQLLIYPATDMRALAPSHRTNGQGYLLTSDSIAYYRGHYIQNAEDWADWRASPLLAADLTRLPPALVLTAGYDPLRDEGRQYADALSAAGNRVQYICFERQIHGFITMSRVLQEALTAVDLCSAVLKRELLEA